MLPQSRAEATQQACGRFLRELWSAALPPAGFPAPTGCYQNSVEGFVALVFGERAGLQVGQEYMMVVHAAVSSAVQVGEAYAHVFGMDDVVTRSAFAIEWGPCVLTTAPGLMPGPYAQRGLEEKTGDPQLHPVQTSARRFE